MHLPVRDRRCIFMLGLGFAFVGFDLGCAAAIATFSLELGGCIDICSCRR